MSTQDNQNGNLLRNLTKPISSSSDICVFKSPVFNVTGANKIECDEIFFNVNSIRFSSLKKSIQECLAENVLNSSCISKTAWFGNIYEDDKLVYSNEITSSDTFNGSSPTLIELNDFLNLAFTNLGYNYTTSGVLYYINQINSASNFKIEISTNVSFNMSNSGCNSTTPFTGDCDVSDVVVDLDFNGKTINDLNIYEITDDVNIPLEFNFTDNIEEFINNDVKFRYELYKFNDVLNVFDNKSIYTSDIYLWDDISGTSGLTETIDGNSLPLDGDFLVKGYFTHNVCTEFGNLMNMSYTTSVNKNGDKYQLYDSNKDYYFTAFSKVEKPIIESTEEKANELGSLTQLSIILDGQTNEFRFPRSEGDVILTLNGLVLSPGIDYTFKLIELTSSTKTLVTLNGGSVEGDVLTFIYTNNSLNQVTNNLKNDTIDIVGIIQSGVTDGEGDNLVYYNTENKKYEVFLELKPINFNDTFLTLNGVTLSNGIDYYQSVSNPKRLIMEGDLVVGDLINVYYNANIVDSNVSSDEILVSWNIITAPQKNNGKFYLQLSIDEEFNTIINEVTNDYTIGRVSYSNTLSLSGNAGDLLYYRVKNEKRFVDVCGNPIVSTDFSDTVKITLETNGINSY